MSDAFEFLTSEACARLRPTVEPKALDRFLAALPPNVRSAVILTFVRQLTAEDVRRVSQDLGEAEHSDEDVERLVEQPVPPAVGTTPNALGSPAFEAVQSINYFVQLEPPDDPELLALWRPIEPGFTDSYPPPGGAV